MMWLSAGIVFARATSTNGAEIFLVQAGGGLPVSIYRDPKYVFIHSVVGR